MLSKNQHRLTQVEVTGNWVKSQVQTHVMLCRYTLINVRLIRGLINSTALAWHAGGAGFESPQDHGHGSFCALTSPHLNYYLMSVFHLSLSEP